MALGLLWPLGPLTAMAPMGMAVGKVHWGRPIWVTEGGAELPVTNMAIAASLAMTGPGRISLDRLLRLRTPWPLTVLTAVGVAAGLALGLYISRERPEEAGPAAWTRGGITGGGGSRSTAGRGRDSAGACLVPGRGESARLWARGALSSLGRTTCQLHE